MLVFGGVLINGNGWYFYKNSVLHALPLQLVLGEYQAPNQLNIFSDSSYLQGSCF